MSLKEVLWKQYLWIACARRLGRWGLRGGRAPAACSLRGGYAARAVRRRFSAREEWRMIG